MNIDETVADCRL